MPTTEEFLQAVAAAKVAFVAMKNDHGMRTNGGAILDLRCIIPAEYERAAAEALQSTQLDASSNPFGQGLAKYEVNPFLEATDRFYVDALGADDRGIIYQERNKLEVVVHHSPEAMDDNDGLKVTLRHRFAFAYGDFTKLGRHVFT